MPGNRLNDMSDEELRDRLTNNVQTFREGLMMSKAELARKAGLSTLTIDRVEAGRPCRLDTKRKILLALGLRVTDKDRVFGMQSESESAQAADQAPRSTSSLGTAGHPRSNTELAGGKEDLLR